MRNDLTRIILGYGLASGVIIIVGIIGTMLLDASHSHSSVWLGYLIMLVALSSILIGVKQYRDNAQGGVIKFGKAFLVGLGIAAVASAAYALIWEAYLAVTHYDFMSDYTAHLLAAKRAAGVTGAAYAEAVAQAEAMKRSYANPVIRMAMTLAEIFPVGLLVALVTAVLVRNPRFLPAKAAA
jgi:hypothetical protein